MRAYRPYPLLAGEEEEEEEETEAEAGGAPAAAAAAAGGGGEAAPAHKKPGGGGGGGGHDKPQPGAQRGVHEHGARLGPLAFAGLAYGSLGVVFGARAAKTGAAGLGATTDAPAPPPRPPSLPPIFQDLGTSPLYTCARARPRNAQGKRARKRERGD